MKTSSTVRRTIRLLSCSPQGIFSFRINQGTEEFRYLGTEVPADFGRSFLVERLGEKAVTEVTYEVSLEGGEYNTDTCTCKGNVRHGHCKHVSGIRALISAGKIV